MGICVSRADRGFLQTVTFIPDCETRCYILCYIPRYIHCTDPHHTHTHPRTRGIVCACVCVCAACVRATTVGVGRIASGAGVQSRRTGSDQPGNSSRAGAGSTQARSRAAAGPEAQGRKQDREERGMPHPGRRLFHIVKTARAAAPRPDPPPGPDRPRPAIVPRIGTVYGPVQTIHRRTVLICHVKA
jgi:hypothetical protein